MITLILHTPNGNTTENGGWLGLLIWKCKWKLQSQDSSVPLTHNKTARKYLDKNISNVDNYCRYLWTYCRYTDIVQFNRLLIPLYLFFSFCLYSAIFHWLLRTSYKACSSQISLREPFVFGSLILWFIIFYVFCKYRLSN